MDPEILTAAAAFEQRNGPRPIPQARPDTKSSTECPKNPKRLHVCPRYKLIVSPRICRRCKRDAGFKQSLFADYIRHRAGREGPCQWAGAVIETEQVPCCNGQHAASIKHHQCSIHKHVTEPDCWVCKDYNAGSEVHGSEVQGLNTTTLASCP